MSSATFCPEAASATPSMPRTLTYEFTGCAGSRETFEAVQQPSEAAGHQLTDGSATFIFMEAIDVQSGVALFTTPGVQTLQAPDRYLRSHHPTTEEELLVKGLLAPVKK